MGQLTDEERDAFLAEPRYGILTTLRGDGSPVAVPVWFDWDGAKVRMFTTEGTSKMRRIRNDARATVLVANNLDEKEKWVAFDGEVAIRDQGGLDLAMDLAERYWDLSDPDRAAALESWKRMKDIWRLLELTPRSIRTYGD
jgi:PPOX class probable F420-dependent enzyme